MTQPSPRTLAPAPLADEEGEARIAELSRLVERQRGRYIAAAWRILRDPVEAEDAVQDALASACHKVDAFRDESQLSTWLYRIVINAALMRLRSKRRRPEAELDTLADVHRSAGEPHDEALERRQLAGVLLHCTEGLSEAQRQLLVARYVDETPLRYIARELDISEGGVKARLHRARGALRTAFFAALGPEPV